MKTIGGRSHVGGRRNRECTGWHFPGCVAFCLSAASYRLQKRNPLSVLFYQLPHGVCVYIADSQSQSVLSTANRPERGLTTGGGRPFFFFFWEKYSSGGLFTEGCSWHTSFNTVKCITETHRPQECGQGHTKKETKELDVSNILEIR